MLSRSMLRTVSIIGAGRVGQTIAMRLRKLGWRIGAIVTRSSASARAAVRIIGAGTPHSTLTRDALDADVILMSVPDDALDNVAHQLSRIGGARFRKKSWEKIILHTSGALDSRVLAPLARLGARTGSMHPMQTFSGRSAPRLDGVIFSIEGAPAARRAAQKIARSLGATPVIIKGDDKPAYHASGTVVAGHALALVESATQMLLKIGFTRRGASQALLPLIRQMLDNYERLGPRAAWTGPLSRGDYATIAKHVKAMRRFPSEFRDAYAALALLSARVLADKRAPAKKRLKRTLARVVR
ncbi:MAG TPA: Rossmann-like and DUF2520 domain-containing protein [Candidatus Acidoferrum sp.]|nr:Rossmann-like and DUF2520 domain-containing protein [Candidatus Acidoferrum sp.]